MMDLSKFNPQQQQAITSTAPYIRVIAGAGSGKTAVLTNRIAYLILKRNIPERNILAITFTNKAAKEMERRVLQIIGKENFSGIIATFHSFCLRVLREDINKLGYQRNFIVVDTDDQKAIIKNINKRLNYDNEFFKVKSIIQYISSRKNNYGLLDYDEVTLKIYEQFYLEYEKVLKNDNLLDFDDLIKKTVELFKSDQLILDKWRFRFPYIHVDEFQDTNELQYQLIKLLAHELNLFVVGDPDQTIYTWRGAKIDFILNFEQDFANAQTIKLEYNYRSRKPILDLANSLIKHNSARIEKDLIATKDSEQKIEHYIGDYPEDEAQYIINKIEQLVSDGAKLSEIAILYRANYISRVFEQYLTKNNINYRIMGTVRFFERKEIKDVIAYLKVVALKDNLSLLRIINVPKRKIGEKSIDKIMSYAQNNELIIYEVLKNHLDDISLSAAQKKNIGTLIDFIDKQDKLSPVEVFDNIMSEFNLLEEYQNNSIEYQSRLDNLNEFRNYLISNNDDLIELLQDMSINSEQENDDEDQVSLMSIHAAKGLEFKYVFVVFLCDGIFPSMYSLDNLNLEEERRLAYVAFTRAEEELYLLSHAKNNSPYTMSSSMFVKELDESLLNKEGRVSQDYHLQPKVNEMTTFLAQKEDDETFKINDVVIHPVFKKGVVLAIKDNILTIAFEKKVGIKQISSGFVSKYD